jgi:hypothetical protein
MTQKIEWGRLHDATLENIVVDWSKGTVQVNFITYFAPIVSIYAQGLSQLIVPHKFPWGPSVSVNDVHWREAIKEGIQRLEIEMQSGDTIVIEAKRVSANLDS